ncbi:MAG: hypothetical protein J7L62_04140 [Candidatus Aminicenantes bacterium]|nr:hypothetical protein [Candidatus Aminicenantes bacterium]
MGTAALFTGYGLLILVVVFVVAAFFLWLGAKIAQIKNAGFGKALLATFLGFIAGIILRLVPAIGWLLGIIAYIVIIKYVFATDWIKALIAWAVSFVITVVLFAIFAFAGLLSIGAFMKAASAKQAAIFVFSSLA